MIKKTSELRQVNNTVRNENENNPLGMKNFTINDYDWSLEICQWIYKRYVSSEYVFEGFNKHY